MNWGKGLVLGLGLMMSFITVLVVMMFRSPDDSFDKNYYEKGLAYDDEYTQKQQVIKDAATPVIKLEDEQIVLQFKAIDSGKVTLQRPSDHLMDLNFSIDKPQSFISTKKLLKGEWKVITQWNYQSKKYLYEQNLFIQ